MLAEVTSPLTGEWMTPRRRFTSAMYRGNVDKVPACTLSSVVTVEMMDLVDAAFPEAHLDAEKMARLAATAHDVFGMDTIMPVFHSQLESDALGGETEWAEKDNWPSPSRFTIDGARAGQDARRLPGAAHDGGRDRRHQAAPARATRTWPSWARSTGRGRSATRWSASRTSSWTSCSTRTRSSATSTHSCRPAWRPRRPSSRPGRMPSCGRPHDRRPVSGRDLPRLPAGDAPAHHRPRWAAPASSIAAARPSTGSTLRGGRLGRLPLRVPGRRARGARDGRRADGPDGQPQQSVRCSGRARAEDVYKACWDLMDAGVDGLAPEGSVPLVTPKEPLMAINHAARRLVGASIAATTASSIALESLHQHLHRLSRPGLSPPTHRDAGERRSMADLKRLQTAVEVGDRETAVEVTEQAIDGGHPPEDHPRRDDRRDGRGRAALPGQRDLRPGDAHQRARHEGRGGAAGAAADRRAATSRTASRSSAPSRATSTTSARTSWG